jgi:hypothetical protein
MGGSSSANLPSDGCVFFSFETYLWTNLLSLLQQATVWPDIVHPVTFILACWSPLWSSGQSSWLQVERSGFDFWSYQISWEVVGPKRGPLGLVSTIETLLGRNSSRSGLESQEYGRGDPSRLPRGILYPQKLALTWPTSGGHSVGIVRSRTQTMEFSC